MTTAQALIKALHNRGFSIRVDGESLFVMPAPDLTNSDREAIREGKVAILAYLYPPESRREITVRWNHYPDHCICFWDKCSENLLRLGLDCWVCVACDSFFRLKPQESIQSIEFRQDSS